MNTPVSYELAKLLKEKEFNLKTSHYYNEGEKLCGGFPCFPRIHNKIISFSVYSAPTIAEVVMWLYEKHVIWIQPMLYRRNPNDFIGGVYYDKTESYFTEPFESPTEAYEKAIEYTLNNLV